MCAVPGLALCPQIHRQYSRNNERVTHPILARSRVSLTVW
jgi:hypothetical protein